MSSQIEQLIKQLGDNTRQKRRAVSKLIRIGEPALEPLLDALERTSDEAVQQAALLILGRIGDKRAVPAIWKILDGEKSHTIESSAITALAQLKAFDLIREALTSSNPAIRQAAANALTKSGQLQDIHLLIPLLDDPIGDVRQAAIRALLKIDEPDVAQELCREQILSDPMMSYMVIQTLLKHDRDCLFETIFKILPNADEQLRISLVSAMWTQHDERVQQFRRLMLNDESSKVRSFAVAELGRSPDIRTNQIEEALIHALQDSDWDVRRSAVWSLRKLGNEAHFDLFLQALQDNHPLVKAAVVDVFGYLREQRAVEHLIPLLQHRHVNVRQSVSRTLRMLGATQAAQPILKSLQDHGTDWAMTMDLAILGGVNIVPTLIDMLQSKKIQDITTAAYTLYHIRDERATQRLIDLLFHQDDTVREAAARALFMIGNSDAINALVTLIDDKNETVATWAVSALPKLEEKQQVLLLVNRAIERSTRWWEMDNIIFTLGKIGGDEVVPILLLILSDETNERQFRAAEALGRLGDERAIEPLIQALYESDAADVVGRAAWALGQISAKQGVPALIETLYEAYDNDPGYSSELPAVIEALGRIGDKRAVEPIIETLDSTRPEVKIAAAIALRKIGDEQAANALVPLLNHTSPDVRRAGVSALRKLGNEDAVEGLISCLQDNNQIIRAMATEALSRIGDSRSTDALIQALYDDRNRIRKAAARGLVKIGLDALPELLKVRIDDTQDVRANRKLVWVLGELGDSRATETLMSIAENISDNRTRSYAIEALGKIGDSRSLEVVMRASADDSSYVRAPAATALAQFRQPQVIERLKTLSDDDNENVRRAAKRSLEVLDTPPRAGGSSKENAL